MTFFVFRYTINTMEYKYSRNQVFLINHHLVWCPKRRKKVLVNKIAKRFKEIFNQVAKEKDLKEEAQTFFARNSLSS